MKYQFVTRKHIVKFIYILINSWIVTVYPSAPWKLICSLFHRFLSSLVYHELDFLWATRRVFLETQRMFKLPVHLVHAPSFSGVRVALLLLSPCMYYCFCYLLPISVFHVLSLSLKCILSISARILVPLITLSEYLYDSLKKESLDLIGKKVSFIILYILW